MAAKAKIVAALQKAYELNNTPRWEDEKCACWFYLAMAHWQLGDRAQARTWYDKAVDWMDKNETTDEDLKRVRAEAAALAGKDGQDE